jgi:hypothetical protein
VAVLPCAIDDAVVGCLTCQARQAHGFLVSLGREDLANLAELHLPMPIRNPGFAFHFTHPRCVPAACGTRRSKNPTR